MLLHIVRQHLLFGFWQKLTTVSERQCSGGSECWLQSRLLGLNPALYAHKPSILGNVVNLSVPQFPHLYIGYNNRPYVIQFGGLNKLIAIKNSEQYLAHSNDQWLTIIVYQNKKRHSLASGLQKKHHNSHWFLWEDMYRWKNMIFGMW